jgi:hypothetical protein
MTAKFLIPDLSVSSGKAENLDAIQLHLHGNPPFQHQDNVQHLNETQGPTDNKPLYDELLQICCTFCLIMNLDLHPEGELILESE